MFFDRLKKCFKTDKLKDFKPHIKVFYTKEIEEIEVFEEIISIRQKYISEQEEIFETLEKLLEFDKKEAIIKMSLINMNISDLSFLTQFPNIESLDLSFNNIKDLTILGSLTKLKKLNLSYNTFLTIKGLGQCINLEQLFMIFNQINDINELKFLSSLKVLDIEETNVNSIEILDELKYLEYVYVPFFCKLGNINNKLKNTVTFSKLLGKGALSSNVYLDKFYILSDGLHCGRKIFD